MANQLKSVRSYTKVLPILSSNCWSLLRLAQWNGFIEFPVLHRKGFPELRSLDSHEQ
jgi:hypothetical protein